MRVCGNLQWTLDTTVGGLGIPQGLLLPLHFSLQVEFSFLEQLKLALGGPSFKYSPKWQPSYGDSGWGTAVVVTLDIATNPWACVLELTRNEYRSRGKESEGGTRVKTLVLMLQGIHLSSVSRAHHFYQQQLLPRIYSVDLDRFCVGKWTISY